MSTCLRLCFTYRYFICKLESLVTGIEKPKRQIETASKENNITDREGEGSCQTAASKWEERVGHFILFV